MQTLAWLVSREGLSPRVRGNRRRAPQRVARPRSIPACAGEPTSCRSTCTVMRVYPRVCGGTRGAADVTSPATGLSPRVRGNPGRVSRRRDFDGSIPACAGEPSSSPSLLVIGKVYPRVCGGTTLTYGPEHYSQGLSPRVRGNRPTPTTDRPNVRSIPACAGEPAPASPPGACGWVYPRVCGGTGERGHGSSPPPGLSPRVRGNQDLLAGSAIGEGSIPACAGEPQPINQANILFQVYPRVCGGTHVFRKQSAVNEGLSPRVRGNPCFVIALPSVSGSIPACAGEP